MHLKKTPRLLPQPLLRLIKPRRAKKKLDAKAEKNQAEDGPNTRRAAIRAYKCLYAMVNQHGSLIQQTYEAAKEHATRSKGTATKDPTATERALWAVGAPSSLLTLAHVSLSVSPFFSPLSLRHGLSLFASKCLYASCYALTACAM